MDELKFQHVYKEIITTIFGTAIIAGALYYFFTHLSDISFEEILVLLAIFAVGVLALVGKDSVILRFLPGYKEKIADTPSETDIPK